MFNTAYKKIKAEEKSSWNNGISVGTYTKAIYVSNKFKWWDSEVITYFLFLEIGNTYLISIMKYWH